MNKSRLLKVVQSNVLMLDNLESALGENYLSIGVICIIKHSLPAQFWILGWLCQPGQVSPKFKIVAAMNVKLHISPQSEENFLPTQTLPKITTHYFLFYDISTSTYMYVSNYFFYVSPTSYSYSLKTFRNSDKSNWQRVLISTIILVSHYNTILLWKKYYISAIANYSLI